MYKIMLADDEGIVIESLQYIIKQNFGEECVVDYAKSGRSVIERSEIFRPEIVIMDIHMPGINGIDAMKEIKKFFPSIIFIVLSAFDKFDYAKEAINLGVLEYLHKPVSKERIVEVLRRGMQQIDMERKKRSNDLIIREKMEAVVPILENGFIYTLLLQEFVREDIANFKNLLEIPYDYGYMMVLVCGEEQIGSLMTNAVGTSVSIQNHYKEMREYIREAVQIGVVGPVMANKIVVFVPFDSMSMSYEERIQVIEQARVLIRQLKSHIDIRFRLGIGSVYYVSEAVKSYSEALKSLLDTTGLVAHVDDLPFACSYEKDYPITIEKAIFEAIPRGDLNLATASAYAFFDWMVMTYPDCMTDIKLKALEFVLWAEHIAYENGGMTYEFRSRREYLPTVIEIEQYDALRLWFVERIENACRNVAAKKKITSIGTVEKAKLYIREHYHKELSLEEVSRQVNISPYYFSKVFKEETGINFIDYLTELRMKVAKQLLLESEKSMKEIGIMVGYSDPNYFSRSFKKNVGKTPTEYKEGGVS
jgi:two-component system response regulator YesN|nr:helix-turn-helix domain-containing protein [uncultured Lachnoclostridium sp.]